MQILRKPLGGENLLLRERGAKACPEINPAQVIKNFIIQHTPMIYCAYTVEAQRTLLNMKTLQCTHFAQLVPLK